MEPKNYLLSDHSCRLKAIFGTGNPLILKVFFGQKIWSILTPDSIINGDIVLANLLKFCLGLKFYINEMIFVYN